MRRIAWMVLAASAAFVAILVARLPASWALALLPASADVQCAEASGTLWAGRCGRFAARGMTFGTLEWRLHPSRLLRGRLAGTVAVHRPGSRLVARVETPLLGGALEARELRAELELEPALLPRLPSTLSGRVSADLSHLHFDGKRLDALAGRIVARELHEAGPSPASLGDYELAFDQPSPVAGPLRGTLRDLGGPLGVQGTVTLTTEPGYLVEGLVATRPDASAELARQIEFLGSPDASGRRPFSLSGSF